ncbi:hypothetical protein PSN45_004644 [Yamadazyma tenuis]|uniref:Uncharacterized protein n=1 Tax=Candida tenuis (strain ATCC 10573 / BCRC 21748 / CBS 615 / JCM 9827 / NBRC 10315 / NRRL Y-1498 / VKM Y-70) TaxID=590646 RepID=G3B735_CANTC|nr:uncharacterized protein CANTEDRAFT_114399 [Yamadazyma tenuis ATCC 10573]EGV63087.1 hypothetical protein CANTEDRAFT_114399 [Yamadazyma tenuis ATCC 10573]WEJ97096.1 hypothetical protein PSN45_004644 [Yamadazyma tenuis]
MSDPDFADTEYNDFMENLTPCSSLATAFSEEDAPVQYNPISFVNLLNKRNSLTKSGTLTDDSASISKFDLEKENCRIKILTPDDESFFIRIEELHSFINGYLPVPCTLDDLSIVHLLIFLSDRYSTTLNSIRLCHFGRSHAIKTFQDLTIKKQRLLIELKVTQYPTMHLIITKPESSPLRLISTKQAIEKTYSTGYQAVTYADAIAHKFRTTCLGSKSKQNLKVRMKYKLKSILQEVIHC